MDMSKIPFGLKVKLLDLAKRLPTKEQRRRFLKLAIKQLKMVYYLHPPYLIYAILVRFLTTQRSQWSGNR